MDDDDDEEVVLTRSPMSIGSRTAARLLANSPPPPHEFMGKVRELDDKWSQAEYSVTRRLYEAGHAFTNFLNETAEMPSIANELDEEASRSMVQRSSSGAAVTAETAVAVGDDILAADIHAFASGASPGSNYSSGAPRQGIPAPSNVSPLSPASHSGGQVRGGSSSSSGGGGGSCPVPAKSHSTDGNTKPDFDEYPIDEADARTLFEAYDTGSDGFLNEADFGQCLPIVFEVLAQTGLLELPEPSSSAGSVHGHTASGGNRNTQASYAGALNPGARSFSSALQPTNGGAAATSPSSSGSAPVTPHAAAAAAAAPRCFAAADLHRRRKLSFSDFATWLFKEPLPGAEAYHRVNSSQETKGSTAALEAQCAALAATLAAERQEHAFVVQKFIATAAEDQRLLEAAESECAALEAENSSLSQEAAAVQEDVDRATQAIDTLSQELAVSQEQLQEQQLQLQQRDEELAQSRASDSGQGGAAAAAAQAQVKEAALIDELTALRDALAAAETENAALMQATAGVATENSLLAQRNNNNSGAVILASSPTSPQAPRPLSPTSPVQAALERASPPGPWAAKVADAQRAAGAAHHHSVQLAEQLAWCEGQLEAATAQREADRTAAAKAAASIRALESELNGCKEALVAAEKKTAEVQEQSAAAVEAANLQAEVIEAALANELARTQAALDRAQHGGDSALRHSDAPTSPSGDKTAAAAALALSPRSAAAIARGAAVALQGARASIFAPMAQQKRALWGTSLKVSRWCCNRAFKVWSLALRKVKHGEASQEAERVRAELEDSWYQRAADEVEAVANESSLTVASAHRNTGLHLLYSTASRHLSRTTSAAWWKWAHMSSEVAHRSQLAERQALLEALTKDKEQLEADLKTATLASTAAREEVAGLEEQLVLLSGGEEEAEAAAAAALEQVSELEALLVEVRAEASAAAADHAAALAHKTVVAEEKFAEAQASAAAVVARLEETLAHRDEALTTAAADAAANAELNQAAHDQFTSQVSKLESEKAEVKEALAKAETEAKANADKEAALAEAKTVLAAEKAAVEAELLTSRADEATASAALTVAESKLQDVEEELKTALSNLEDVSKRAVEAAELTAEAQTFAQDAEIAATAATQRNASLERELLALKDDTDTAAAEQLKKLEELTSALKEAQEAVTAAEEQAREASQKQAEAEDAAQKAIAAEAAKEEAAQFKVSAAVATNTAKIAELEAAQSGLQRELATAHAELEHERNQSRRERAAATMSALDAAQLTRPGGTAAKRNYFEAKAAQHTMAQAPKRRNSDSTAMLLLNEPSVSSTSAVAAGGSTAADTSAMPSSPSGPGGIQPNSPPQTAIVNVDNNPFASPMMSPSSPRLTASPFTSTSPKIAAAFESAFADLFPEPSPSTAVALQQELAAQAARVIRLESELARATAKALEAIPPGSGGNEADNSGRNSGNSSPNGNGAGPTGQSAASLAMNAELNAERKRSERLATELRERNNLETALARDKATIFAALEAAHAEAVAELTAQHEAVLAEALSASSSSSSSKEAAVDVECQVELEVEMEDSGSGSEDINKDGEGGASSEGNGDDSAAAAKVKQLRRGSVQAGKLQGTRTKSMKHREAEWLSLQEGGKGSKEEEEDEEGSDDAPSSTGLEPTIETVRSVGAAPPTSGGNDANTAELQSLLDAARADVASEKATSAERTAAVEKLESDLKQTQDQVEQLQAQLEAAVNEHEVKLAAAIATKAAEEAATEKEASEASAASKAASEETIFALSSELEEAQAAVTAAQFEKEALLAQVKAAEEKLTDCMEDLASARAETLAAIEEGVKEATAAEKAASEVASVLEAAITDAKSSGSGNGESGEKSGKLIRRESVWDMENDDDDSEDENAANQEGEKGNGAEEDKTSSENAWVEDLHQKAAAVRDLLRSATLEQQSQKEAEAKAVAAHAEEVAGLQEELETLQAWRDEHSKALASAEERANSLLERDKSRTLEMVLGGLANNYVARSELAELRSGWQIWVGCLHAWKAGEVGRILSLAGSWGMNFTRDTLKVTDVAVGLQAHHMGIRVGWRLVAAHGTQVHNLDELGTQVKARKASGYESVHVTFAYKVAPRPSQSMQTTLLEVLRAGMPVQKVGRNGKPSARVLVLDDTPKTMRTHGGAPVLTWRSTSRVALLSKAQPRLPLTRLQEIVAWSEPPPNATPPAHVSAASSSNSAHGGNSGSSGSSSTSIDAACCVTLYFQSAGGDDSGDAFARSNSGSSASSNDSKPSGDAAEADECIFELVCPTPESARTLSVIMESLMRSAKGLEPSPAPPSPSASQKAKPPSPLQPPRPLPAPVPAASNAPPLSAAAPPAQTQPKRLSMPPRPTMPPPAKSLMSTTGGNGAALADRLQEKLAASKQSEVGAAAPAVSARVREHEISPASSPGDGESGALAARRAKVAAKKSAAAAAAAAPPPLVSSSSGGDAIMNATHADILRRAQEQANAPPGQGNTAL